MSLDWRVIDRYLMGEAWAGSRIRDHVQELCETIGPRWSSSASEKLAIDYIRNQMQDLGLDKTATEEYRLDTWAWTGAQARVVPGDRPIGILPFNRCPACRLEGTLVDAGFGTQRELDRVRRKLTGAVAVMNLAYEPFTEPAPHTSRLSQLGAAGVSAVVVIEIKHGRRMEYHSAGDWRDSGMQASPLAVVVTSREHGALLRRYALENRSLQVSVQSEFTQAHSANVAGEITGTRWPDEHLILGAHHDTVYDSPGGNDNASGVAAVLETARTLCKLRAETGTAPGRSLRFVTFSAEEQKFQGATAYVKRHYGPERPPRLAINLDELSTGHMKGLVLGFPHLQDFIQHQLDTMHDALQCHVMSQIDASSDHFPFLAAGMDAAHLWRWRFHGRHPDADFHHEAGDTADKVNVRELKEYVGQLARLLLRLSHSSPEQWPENPVTPEQVRDRLQAERGTVVRLF